MAIEKEIPPKVEKEMGVREIAPLAGEALSKILNKKLDGVIGVSKEEEGWRVTVEVVEKETPTTISDILGIYDVRLNEAGDLIGYERRELRQRIPALRRE